MVADVYALAGITADTLDGATQVGMDIETMMMLGGPGSGGMSAGGAWAVAGGRGGSGGLAEAYASGRNPYRGYGVNPESPDAHWLKRNWKTYEQKWVRGGASPPKLRELDPAVEESLGGHTIQKHVGKSDQHLRNRLKDEPDIPAASTYESFTEAKTYMDKVATKRKVGIETWLKSGTGKTKEFTADFPDAQIGRRISQEEARKSTKPHSVSDATIVIKRDPSAPDGYIVITSFPGPAI
ncbi:RNase A-like domain-containing protein [Streptomyces sp. NPDC058001]|uniref:RNase A-like domain-containing protein n=1 Tax=Streptomyces sp. NPDC058001 TaxID=3346300 RepID=UPI0036F128E6